MPNKNRATTIQAKFGFVDADLKTPAHDAIMVWLDGEAENIAKSFVMHRMECSEAAIAQHRIDAEEIVRKLFSGQSNLTGEWQGLGDPPKPQFLGLTKIWESPISTPSKFIAGFVDMEVRARYEQLGVSYSNNWSNLKLPSWGVFRVEVILLFEVKSTISSVGELIRQIRLYQEYKEGNYAVVSPDDRFANLLRGQGIGFLKVPSDYSVEHN